MTAVYVVPFDIDCEACGYNLRGLPRPEVVCPECGHAVEFAVLLDRHVRRLEAEEADRPARQERRLDSLELGARISAWAISISIVTLIATVASAWFRARMTKPIVVAAVFCCLTGSVLYWARTQGLLRRWRAFWWYQLEFVPPLVGLWGLLFACTAAATAIADAAVLPILLGGCLVATRWTALQGAAKAARSRIAELMRDETSES